MFITGAVSGAVCSVKSQEDRNNKVAVDGWIDLTQLSAWRKLEWGNDERKTRPVEKRRVESKIQRTHTRLKSTIRENPDQCVFKMFSDISFKCQGFAFRPQNFPVTFS